MSLIKVEAAVSQFAEQDQDLVSASESQLQSTGQRQDKPYLTPSLFWEQLLPKLPPKGAQAWTVRMKGSS